MSWVTDDLVVQKRVVGLEAVAVNIFCAQHVVGLGEKPWDLGRRYQDFTALECRQDTVQAVFRELGSSQLYSWLGIFQWDSKYLVVSIVQELTTPREASEIGSTF